MPGLTDLNDREFLKAFQLTDAIIQNKNPLFMSIWIGSIASILAAILVSLASVGFQDSWLIVLVGVAYLLDVQDVTVVIHIPLNYHIQKIKFEDLNDKVLF